MNVLVTGANGQLGQCIQEMAELWPKARFFYTDVAELDILKKSAVRKFFKENNIAWCINCAAYTAVDKAETDKFLCKSVNVTGARHLALACSEFGAKMIHISSDYVYHNKHNTPMSEESPTLPKGIYALTKLTGDRSVLKACSKSIILRTSWVYSHKGHNFVKTMLRLGAERDRLNVVYDQIGAPTFAPDIVSAIFHICQAVESESVNMKRCWGVFNFANEGVTSWYDFAVAIFDLKSMPCTVGAIRSSQYPTPAARPPYSVLDKSKIQASYPGISMPHWRNALVRCLEKIG